MSSDRHTRRPVARGGFTLIEMLTSVALLVIVLGMMVSLARHVRERSSQALTESLLRQLDQLMTQYADRNAGKLPEVPAFPPAEALPPESAFQPATGATAPATTPNDRPGGPQPDAARGRADQRQLLLRSALANNQAAVAALGAESPHAQQVLAGMPISVSDASQVRDAWGSPIVFMAQMHPWIGTAPLDQHYFFFSAGPDRQYLTRDDNLYSYEEIVGSDRRRQR